MGEGPTTLINIHFLSYLGRGEEKEKSFTERSCGMIKKIATRRGKTQIAIVERRKMTRIQSKRRKEMNRTVNTQNISPERENCMEKLMSGGMHGKQN